MNDRQRPAVGAAIGILIAVLAVTVLVLLTRTWSLTDDIRNAQKTNTAVLETVNDCTKPSGACYQRGKEQTAAAVGDINKVVILAAACASGLPPDMSVPERQSAISACVIDRLAADAN